MLKTFDTDGTGIDYREFVRALRKPSLPSEEGEVVSKVAAALGIPASRLSELLAGRLRLNAELALRLARVWPDADAGYWLNIQNELDLREARTAKAAALRRLRPLKPLKRVVAA